MCSSDLVRMRNGYVLIAELVRFGAELVLQLLDLGRLSFVARMIGRAGLSL